MASFALFIHTFCPAAIAYYAHTTRAHPISIYNTHTSNCVLHSPARRRVVLSTLATYLAIYSGMLRGCIRVFVRFQWNKLKYQQQQQHKWAYTYIYIVCVMWRSLLVAPDRYLPLSMLDIKARHAVWLRPLWNRFGIYCSFWVCRDR